MVVLILEKVKPSLRGLISRWMLEPKTGVFVGTLSKRVRDLLWEEVLEKLDSDGGAMLIFPAQNEQGFDIWSAGVTKHEIINAEGLWLVRKPHKDKEAALKKMKLGYEAEQLLRQRRERREALERERLENRDPEAREQREQTAYREGRRRKRGSPDKS